jgi:hypothetical protein
MPEPKMTTYEFPREAFVNKPPRPYDVIGMVRSKADFFSLDANHDESTLCRNYYNRAVSDLVKIAKEQGGDAVLDVRSVVMLFDGKTETYPTPECSDEGAEGQVLVQGTAIKWKRKPGEPETTFEPLTPAPVEKNSEPKERFHYKNQGMNDIEMDIRDPYNSTLSSVEPLPPGHFAEVKSAAKFRSPSAKKPTYVPRPSDSARAHQ